MVFLKCFGLRKPRGRGAQDSKAKPFKRSDLEVAMREASTEVKQWDTTCLVPVRDIQNAVRNYGKVQLMRDMLHQGRFAAVKRMPRAWMCNGPEEFDILHPLASEKPWVDVAIVRMLNNIDYPYACRLYDVFQRGGEMLVATSFCSEGDLFEWCFHPSVPQPGLGREAHMRPFIVQLLAAVRDLHDLGIAHRDLSLENLLLVDTGTGLKLKLIDFGMATLKRNVRNELRGKASYQAPEVHSGRSMDAFLGDNFSLGVVLFAMAVQDYPWASTQRGRCRVFDYMAVSGLRKLLTKRPLRKGSGELLSEVMSPGFVEVLDALLMVQPRQRGCLGEDVYLGEVCQRRRANVWEMEYLRGAEPATPVPATAKVKPVWPAPTSECCDEGKLASSSVSTCSHCSAGSASPSGLSSLEDFLKF